MRKWGRRYGFGDGLATTPADRGVMVFHGRRELTAGWTRGFYFRKPFITVGNMRWPGQER